MTKKRFKRRLIYTDYYPFHITAQSKQKCWPGGSKNEVWKAFSKELNTISQDLKIKVHAFVLMSNHYHLLATSGPDSDLWNVVQDVQEKVSSNLKSKKSLFKAPTQAFRITAPLYYKRALKYIYRNPVEAGICSRVESYKFSTLNSTRIQTVFPYNMDSLIDYREKHILPWLNEEEPGWGQLGVDKSLLLSGFECCPTRFSKN